MILIDFNQMCVASYAGTFAQFDDGTIDMELFRHTVINSLRVVNSKFRKDWGMLVIVADSGKSWRKDFFPYYKAKRNQDKTESKINWQQLHVGIRTVLKELHENFPYPVIVVANAEGDDLIGAITRWNSDQLQPTLIISSDKDFLQLQINNHLVQQFDNIHQRWITHDDPARYMFEHVLKGDRGDGIPNAYCPDDYFINKYRRHPIRSEKLDQLWESGDIGSIPYFRRNIRLVDLRNTPQGISEEAVQMLLDHKPIKGKVMQYLAKNRLSKLMDSLGDF